MSTAEQLITQHLHIWSSTVRGKSSPGGGSGHNFEAYGVTKLRELILQLAVRGLLVQQDPGDDSASDLLKKVIKERALLGKEGILKNNVSLSPEEIASQYPIPESWVWTRMGIIGNVFNGNSINARLKKDKYTGVEGYPFIATKDVGYGFTDLVYDNGIRIPRNERGFKIAHKGAILICSEGGSAGKKCGITNTDICFGNKLFANELLGGISPKFILSVYLSPTFNSTFSESMTGIIGGISKSKFEALPCPLPPLAEQQRIVARVDELMALCDQLEERQEQSVETHHTLVRTLLEALTNAQEQNQFDEAWKRIGENFDVLFTTEDSIDELKMTILRVAVTGKLVEHVPDDEPASCVLNRIAKPLPAKRSRKSNKTVRVATEPFSLPEHWSWARFPQLGEFGRGKSKHRPRNDPSLFEGGTHKLIQTGDVARSDGIIATYSALYNEAGLAQSKLWPAGTLCITIAANIADSGILGFDACFPDSVVGLIPDAEFPSAKYFEYFLRTAKDHLDTFATATAQKNINLGVLEKLMIPLPPAEEQKRIVAKIDELMVLCDTLKTSLRASQEIKVNLSNCLVDKAAN